MKALSSIKKFLGELEPKAVISTLNVFLSQLHHAVIHIDIFHVVGFRSVCRKYNVFIFCYSMDWYEARGYFHAVSGHGKCLRHEDEYVSGNRRHGEPHCS